MHKKKGFTLVELMVVIVIIGLLMAYALPSYHRQVMVSKRTEAMNTLLKIAATEEKHNATYNTYTDIIDGNGNDGDSLGYDTGEPPIDSDNYNYVLEDNDDDADGGYTIRARGKNISTQREDTTTNTAGNVISCRALRLDALGRKRPLACWQ